MAKLPSATGKYSKLVSLHVVMLAASRRSYRCVVMSPCSVILAFTLVTKKQSFMLKMYLPRTISAIKR